LSFEFEIYNKKTLSYCKKFTGLLSGYGEVLSFHRTYERSEARIPLDVLLEAIKPLEHFPWLNEKDVTRSVLIVFLHYILATVLRILRIKVD